MRITVLSWFSCTPGSNQRNPASSSSRAGLPGPLSRESPPVTFDLGRSYEQSTLLAPVSIWPRFRATSATARCDELDVRVSFLAACPDAPTTTQIE
jgi:hypothetical protein